MSFKTSYRIVTCVARQLSRHITFPMHNDYKLCVHCTRKTVPWMAAGRTGCVMNMATVPMIRYYDELWLHHQTFVHFCCHVTTVGYLGGR